MTVDDIFDALYLQAKDQIGLTRLRDIVLTDESINRLQFNREGQEPIEFIKVKHGVEKWEDAEPTKHGRWIEVSDGSGYVGEPCEACSVCGMQTDDPSNYCPNCGARMDAQIGEDKSHPFAESVMMGMDEVKE